MVEFAVLAIFSISLFACIGLKASVLIALVFGFFLFFFYGLYKKHTAHEMLSMAFTGIKSVKNVLINFVLIGVITAVWRACGTIPFIVYHATAFCNPHIMVLLIFLLCSLISFLTGTAFGTSATMGVICITIANSMGIPIFFSGGAVISGAYFGDRCSPMSTSALLISTLTKTDLFRNISNMFKTSVVPFAITCCIYAVAGLGFNADYDVSGIQKLFSDSFVLHPAVIIPAAVIIIFSLFKINVKITMSVSILCGIAVAVFIQKIAPAQIPELMFFGYNPEKAELNALLSGGGIFSMVKVFLIVCISSCYSGMFNSTGLLNRLKELTVELSKKISPFGSVLLSSVFTGVIACNQTLTIMLTHQLCEKTDESPEQLASNLENTAVLVPALIPWSTAAAVPIQSIGAPMLCLLTACYIYILPLWNYAAHLYRKNKEQKNGNDSINSEKYFSRHCRRCDADSDYANHGRCW